MLRITHQPSNGTPTLRLEGKLLQPWVEELRSAVSTARAASPSLRLDLAAITYVDSDGTALLRELLRTGVTVGPCSPYVSSLLERGTP